MVDCRKHPSFHELSVQELEAEELLEEELAERDDVRRFDEGFAAYEERLEDEELDRVDPQDPTPTYEREEK